MGLRKKVNIGRKTPEELADAVRVEFNCKVAMAKPDYLKNERHDASDFDTGTT